jgi:hypothetical protein
MQSDNGVYLQKHTKRMTMNFTHVVHRCIFLNEFLKEFDLYLHHDIYIVINNENKIKFAIKEDIQHVKCSADYFNKILQNLFTMDDIKCDTVQLLFKTIDSIVTDVLQCHKQCSLSSHAHNYS